MSFASAGGVLIAGRDGAEAYLISYSLGLKEDESAGLWDKTPYFASHPTFDTAVDEVANWLAYPGTLSIGISRCSPGYLGQVEDSSAQLALAVGWRALINQKWYAPLLRHIVFTGALELSCGSCAISGVIGNLEGKITHYAANRRAHAKHFRLFVLPQCKEPQIAAVRVLRSDSIDDLERRLIGAWSRAAFYHLRRATILLAFTSGQWPLAALLSLVVATSWYWLPDYWYGLIVFMLVVGFIFGLSRLLAAEAKRMDDEERQQNRHNVVKFEDLLDIDQEHRLSDVDKTEGVSKTAWVEMLTHLSCLVRSAPAKWFCRWACDKAKRSREFPQGSTVPFFPWRSTNPYLGVTCVVGLLAFVTLCPLRRTVAEILSGGSQIDLKFRYRASDGSLASPERDNNGTLLVASVGDLSIRTDPAPRAERKLRISCASPSGVESIDNVRPRASQVDDCMLFSHDTSCSAERGTSISCIVPASGELRFSYHFAESSRAKVTVVLELVTNRNDRLASLRESARWNPELGNPDADGVAH